LRSRTAKLFCQVFPKNRHFSPSFSKEFLGGFECFQGVKRPGWPNFESPNFFALEAAPPRLSRNGIFISREAKVKPKRNEIASPAKSRVLLSL
jgi:hypothetical protein